MPIPRLKAGCGHLISKFTLAVGMVGSRNDKGCERRAGKSNEGGLDQSGGRKDGAGTVARGSTRNQIDRKLGVRTERRVPVSLSESSLGW